MAAPMRGSHNHLEHNAHHGQHQPEDVLSDAYHHWNSNERHSPLLKLNVGNVADIMNGNGGVEPSNHGHSDHYDPNFNSYNNNFHENDLANYQWQGDGQQHV